MAAFVFTNSSLEFL